MVPSRVEDRHGGKDERYTSTRVIEWMLRLLGEERFDLDVFACAESHFAPRYYTKRNSGLTNPWDARCWFANPPFTLCAEAVERAWSQGALARYEKGGMLLPATRCEQPWWQEHVEPFRDRGRARHGYLLETHNFPGRPQFTAPGGKRLGSSPFPVVALLWRRTLPSSYNRSQP